MITNNGSQLLFDKEIRKKIIWKLTEREAISLLEELGATDFENPYKKLAEARYFGNKEQILFDFFDVELPPKEETIFVPDTERIDSDYTLHPYQKDIVLRSMETLHQKDGTRFMIHMPTGSGKTSSQGPQSPGPIQSGNQT